MKFIKDTMVNMLLIVSIIAIFALILGFVALPIIVITKFSLSSWFLLLYLPVMATIITLLEFEG